MIANEAKKQKCYIICPTITKKDGHFYNSAILINREGKTQGVFHKVHPVSTEIISGQYYKKSKGVTPGPIKAPVYETDFGRVGMQICFDANWTESWKSLSTDGAELVGFPSQGPFTYTLRNHAWMNQYAIVSATGEDAQIVDKTGDSLALDGEFARWVCAPVNLEKEIVQIWPQVLKFKDIQKKYGRKLHIKIYHEENWASFESLDPDVKIKDVLKEYDIPTFDEQIREATARDLSNLFQQPILLLEVCLFLLLICSLNKFFIFLNWPAGIAHEYLFRILCIQRTQVCRTPLSRS